MGLGLWPPASTFGGVAVTRQNLHRTSAAALRAAWYSKGAGFTPRPPRPARRAAPSAISSSTRDGPRGRPRHANAERR